MQGVWSEPRYKLASGQLQVHLPLSRFPILLLALSSVQHKQPRRSSLRPTCARKGAKTLRKASFSRGRRKKQKGVTRIKTAIWLCVPGAACHLVVLQSSSLLASRACLLQSNQFRSEISQASVTLSENNCLEESSWKEGRAFVLAGTTPLEILPRHSH